MLAPSIRNTKNIHPYHTGRRASSSAASSLAANTTTELAGRALTDLESRIAQEMVDGNKLGVGSGVHVDHLRGEDRIPEAAVPA